MTLLQYKERYLEQAWHEETAANSIDRWINIGRCEDWASKPENLEQLIRIFGASWYFTRYVFVGGENALALIDGSIPPEFERKDLYNRLLPVLDVDDAEYAVGRLRLLKNGIMLQVLACYFRDELTLSLMERILTDLAETSLQILLTLLQREASGDSFPVTILGMGRMAGYEMTFGSDLDLIFLYESEDQDMYASIGKTIRLLLRTIAQPAATGILYEVDMRLRPHGNSGPLVTSYNTFVEHHAAEREVWERQMMTRSRPVLVQSENLDTIMQKVQGYIYSQYETGMLRSQILDMRRRVQKELGSPRGKYDIKRGAGGIMDIDFITHYLQLGHGHEVPDLRTPSTRAAISRSTKHNLIKPETGEKLLGAYNYLKRLELCLRLFDLKSVDTFSVIESQNLPLSRAMGHGNDSAAFYREYESVTKEVRRIFEEVIGKV